MRDRRTEKRKIGDIGESIAETFLTQKGYKVIERNYWKPWGEIDIVAEKAGTVRFVEVKTVSRSYLPTTISHETSGYRPEEQIHPKKLQKIAQTAELYMENKRDRRDFQIDAVTVYLVEKERKARCALYEQIL